MLRESTNLVLGRGEVYFDPFNPGTLTGSGERYFGNTMSFKIQRDLQTQERWTSFRGRKVKLAPFVISENHSIDISCDHISAENTARWLGSQVETVTRVAETVSEVITVTRGSSYQLGTQKRAFIGLRDLAHIEVYKAGVMLDAAPNFVTEPTTGRIAIKSNAVAIGDGDVLTVSYSIRARTEVTTNSEAAICEGSLRFVSFNEGTRGRPRLDFYFPKVTLIPKGQSELKGDQFQQWGFSATALNAGPGVEQLYVSLAATDAQRTVEEQQLLNNFGSFPRFIRWEDILDTSVNVGWPHALQNPIFN